jgi:Transposase DDE domain
MSILGDKRLDRVQSRFLKAMETRQSVVIRQLSINRKEEVSYGRFLNNPNLHPELLVKAQSTVFQSNCTGQHVLLVEDTSIASFGLHTNRGTMGYVGKSTQLSGFNLHPVIGLSALNGVCLGLFGLLAWQRPEPEQPLIDPTLDKEAREAIEKAFKKQKHQKLWKQPFEQKEYYKWYSAIEQAVANCPTAASYTVISDREGDVYEALNGYEQKGWDYVIRSSSDRKLHLSKSEKKDPLLPKTLYQALNTWSVQGCYTIDLPKTDKRTAHKAQIEIKFGSLNIECPNWTIKKQYDKSLALYVIEVTEQAKTVVNGEKPIHWILLTSHPITNTEQALVIIQYYRWRWVIEQLFRTIKSQGLDIEHSEVETYEGLVNLATMALMAAVLVMQLVQAREGLIEQPINQVFTPIEIQCLEALNSKLEGNTDKQKNPNAKNSLAFASWVIARLGGWSGYKSERPPGPITMKNGIIRFYDILNGFILNSQNQYVNELVCIP